MRRWWFIAVAGVGLALALACAPAAQRAAPAPEVGEFGTGAQAQPAVINFNKLGGSLNVLTTWDQPRIDKFQAAMAEWSKGTEIKMVFETTKDVDATLAARVAEKKSPDAVIVSSAAAIEKLVKDKRGPVPGIATWMDIETFQYGEYYPSSWLQQSSSPGPKGIDAIMRAVAFDSVNRSVVWYNPKEFKANNWAVPSSWSELTALQDKMVAAGKTPWSINPNDGATAAFWIENILLRSAGPEAFDKWRTYKIKWSDPAVRKAFETLGQIVGNPKYVAAAPDPVSPLYQAKPTAAMLFGDDVAVREAIKKQFPALKPGDDYNVFVLPSIDAQFGAARVVTPDLFFATLAATGNTDQTRDFFNYLTKPVAGELGLKQGFRPPYNGIRPEAYPDALTRDALKLMTKDGTLRFSASESMPPAMRDAFYQQAQAFVADPKSIDQVLAALEAVAVEAYKPPEKKP